MTTLRLWTIQPLYVWESLRKEGALLVDPTHPDFLSDFDGPDDPWNFRDAYDWLREQMAERIPGYGGHYPWWAYEDPKPDLRRCRYGIKIPHVRLELFVPAEEVLLSCFDDWYFVLNRWYFSAEQQALDDAWDAELEQAGLRNHCYPLPEPYQTRLRESWECILDVEARRDRNDRIQATFETLRLENVVRVTHFLPATPPRQNTGGISA